MGEVKALRWREDVDLVAGTITVNQQIRHGVLGTPKGRTRRVVPMTPTLHAALTHVRDWAALLHAIKEVRRDVSRQPYAVGAEIEFEACRRHRAGSDDQHDRLATAASHDRTLCAGTLLLTAGDRPSDAAILITSSLTSAFFGERYRLPNCVTVD